jgi:hypothetical protein
LKDNLKKLTVEFEGMAVHKVFVDVFPDNSKPYPARVLLLDPRIMEIKHPDLFFDIFSKNLKKFREEYIYKE